MKDNMREGFENKYGRGHLMNSGEYANTHKQEKWEVWQAAYASRDPEVKELKRKLDDALGDVDLVAGKLFAQDNLRLSAEVEELQDKIDRLTLEFCPRELTLKQKIKWAYSQKGVK